jgi:hypothetical protein
MLSGLCFDFSLKRIQMVSFRFVTAIALSQSLDIIRGETTCPAGYALHRPGLFQKKICMKDCPDGFVEADAFRIWCRRPTYGRGGGYAWSLASTGQSKCEAAHGVGNCEKWGLLWYQKCKEFWHNAGCCLCEPDLLDCEALGLGLPVHFGRACLKKTLE